MGGEGGECQDKSGEEVDEFRESDHPLKEVTERTGRETKHHSVEFEKKYDRNHVEFKSRSG